MTWDWYLAGLELTKVLEAILFFLINLVIIGENNMALGELSTLRRRFGIAPVIASGDSTGDRRRLRIAPVDAVGEGPGDIARGAARGLCCGGGFVV